MHCLGGKIGQQFFTGRALRQVRKFFIHRQILGGQQHDKVLNEAGMETAGGGTDVQNPVDFEKKDFAVFSCHDTDAERAVGRAGIGICESLARKNGSDDVAVPPVVFLDDIDGAADKQADRADAVSVKQDEFAFFIFFLFCGKTFQHGTDLVFFDAGKKNGLQGCRNFFFHESLQCWKYNIFNQPIIVQCRHSKQVSINEPDKIRRIPSCREKLLRSMKRNAAAAVPVRRPAMKVPLPWSTGRHI